MRTFLELPKQVGLPAWLDGRHSLYLTEEGGLVDGDGEALDRDTFIRMREELGARILTNAPGKVAKALGFRAGMPPASCGPFLRTQDRVPIHVFPVFPWLEVLACLAPCPYVELVRSQRGDVLRPLEGRQLLP